MARAASIAERLRELRRRARLTQEELAARAGVSVRTVRNLESGRVGRPRAGSLRALAAALGLTEGDADAFEAAAWPPADAAAGNEAGGEPSATRPAMLPAAVPVFVARERELGELDRTDAVTVLSGTAGVGKTTLAVHWAHRVRDRFTDGQLYLDLRGFDRSGSPMSPEEASRALLEALGVPLHRIPADLAARSGLYRTLIDGRRILVVLDNALDADQVRPLLPGTSTARVVITSRNTLLGLIASADVRMLEVELLTSVEARWLLAERMDIVLGDDPVIEEILRACAGLPLALALVAARARASGGRSPIELAAELRTGSGPFAVVTGDDVTDLRKVFQWSYRALSPLAAKIFRRAGLHPGPELSIAAAAALADLPLPSAGAACAELVTAHLVSGPAGDRYRMHDLLHTFATELAAEFEPPAERRRAQHRMLDHYLHTAVAADRRLEPHRDPIEVPDPVPGAVVVPIADRQEALAWFNADHTTLVRAVDRAAEEGFDAHAGQLAWALVEFLDVRGFLQDFVRTQLVALHAGRRLGDREAQARALRLLANATMQSGDTERAIAYMHEGLDLFVALSDLPGQAATHLNLSLMTEQLGQHLRANGHAADALGLYRQAGHRIGEAIALNSLGYGHALTGELGTALELCEESLTISRELGHRKAEAHTIDSLGYIHAKLGDPDRAGEYYLQVIGLFREFGDHYQEADALLNYGDTRTAAGDADAGREAWLDALSLLDELGHPRAAEARDRLATGR